MAYVPPYRRNAADGAGRAPLAESLAIPFRQKLKVNQRSPHGRGKGKKDFWAEKIVYAHDCPTRWWVVGSMEDDHVPESMRLEAASVSLFENESKEKPFVLVKSDPLPKESLLFQQHLKI